MCCPIPVLNMSPERKHETALTFQLLLGIRRRSQRRRHLRSRAEDFCANETQPTSALEPGLTLSPQLLREGSRGQRAGPAAPESQDLRSHGPGPELGPGPGLSSRRQTRPDLSSRGADPPPALFSSRPCCRSRRRPLAPDLILGISAGSGRTGPGSRRGPERATQVTAPRGNRRPRHPTTPSPLGEGRREARARPPFALGPAPRKRAGLGAQGPPGIVVMS